MTNVNEKKILLLEGYARQALPFIRSFKKMGCCVSVLCDSKVDVAYLSKYPDEKILGVCNDEHYEETLEWVRKLVLTGKYDLTMSMGDLSERILAENKEEFSKYTFVMSNDKEVFDIASDKLSVMKICMENNIPCPKTLFNIEDSNQIFDSALKYPFVVKPRSECGARGFHVINNENEFEELEKELNKDFSNQVIQEYIPQNENCFSANLFIDKNGEVKSSFVYQSPRWFPLHGGTGTFNVLVKKPGIVKQCEALAKLVNLRGCCGFDLMEDPRDGKAKILEINPRPMACTRIGFEVGIDLAKQALEYAFEDKVSEIKGEDKEVRIRITQTDLLWFLKSSNRFKTKPAWVNPRHTKDQLFYADDIKPWFGFLFRGLKTMKKRDDV